MLRVAVYRAAVRLLAMSSCLACGGCLVSSGASVSYGPTGPCVGDETLEKIEPGKTTKAWLVSVLGEPTHTREVDEETEVLTYEYVKKEQASFCVFFLLGTGAHNEKRSRLFVELRDGVVQRHWRDRKDTGQ